MDDASDVNSQLGILYRIYGVAVRNYKDDDQASGKGFHLACDDIGPEQRLVVYPGAERFSIGHGVDAIGLPALAAQLQLVR